MAATYTVDASVFISAFNTHEAEHAHSHAFMEHLKTRSIPIIVPTLLLPELAASLSRGHVDAALAIAFADAVRRLPHVMLIPLEEMLSRRAADVATKHRLRGADAVYAAVARHFGCELVTLDRQQRERVATIVDAATPQEALARLLSADNAQGAEP